MDALVWIAFGVLGSMAGGLEWLKHRTKLVSSATNPQFVALQREFLTVYFLALFADWLQGPYVYKLYSHYGYDDWQIAMLYVVGFGSSMIFGTATGPLADRWGRKKMCIMFSVTYSLCCLTKLSGNYGVLMFGRVLGGISTSMLFSAFESWYVHEHVETFDFPSEWIAITFSKATFWNGLLAIVAGVIANCIADTMHFGPVGPFVLAIPFLVLSGIVARGWRENVGRRQALAPACMAGLRCVLTDSRVMLLGIVQATFESVMYIFVFLWTPILQPVNPPLGLVFSCFMAAIMVGSALNTILLSRKISAQYQLVLSISLALFAVILCCGSPPPSFAFFAFLILEVAIGLYFPVIGYLRSQVIPDALRANVMNWFRVPLNCITCLGLLWCHSGAEPDYGQTFTACAALLTLSTVASVLFTRSRLTQGIEAEALIT